MPDFAERVRAGQNFLVAGERFGIGSSREMSPAGLLGVARDAGRTLVLVLGAGVGEIFRRNALNLGLPVLECPAAAEDAEDGHRFSFDPRTRRLVNESLGRAYDPKPLTGREESLRRTGGIVALGRREFLAAPEAETAIEWPEPREARRLTATEQILWAHRAHREARVTRGEALLVAADLLPASDGTAPFAIHTFREITGGAIRPRQAAIANDHFVFTGREADRKQTAISAAFAAAEGLEHPWFATPGDGIFHFYFPEQGLVMPGAVMTRRGTVTAGPTAPTGRWASGWVPRRSVSAGPPARLAHASAAAPGRLHRHPSPLVAGEGCGAGAPCPLGRGRRRDVGRVRRSRAGVAHPVAQHHLQHDGGGRGVERHFSLR